MLIFKPCIVTCKCITTCTCFMTSACIVICKHTVIMGACVDSGQRWSTLLKTRCSCLQYVLSAMTCCKPNDWMLVISQAVIQTCNKGQTDSLLTLTPALGCRKGWGRGWQHQGCKGSSCNERTGAGARLQVALLLPPWAAWRRVAPLDTRPGLGACLRLGACLLLLHHCRERTAAQLMHIVM